MLLVLGLGINWWLMQVGVPIMLAHAWTMLLWALPAFASLALGVRRASSSPQSAILLLAVAFPLFTIAPLLHRGELLSKTVMPGLAFALSQAAWAAYLLVGVISFRAPRRRPPIGDPKWRRRFRFYRALAVLSVLIPIALLGRGAAIAIDSETARLAQTAKMILLAAAAILIIRELPVAALEDHVSHDAQTRASLDAAARRVSRGYAAPYVAAWLLAALVALLAFASERLR